MVRFPKGQIGENAKGIGVLLLHAVVESYKSWVPERKKFQMVWSPKQLSCWYAPVDLYSLANNKLWLAIN